MGRQRDHLGLDDGELEHGWAGSVEIDAERPNTGLGPDPAFRKWAALGIGGSCVLTAALVLLSSRDTTSVDAVEQIPSEPSVVSEVEPAPTLVEPTVVEPAPTIAIAPTPTVADSPAEQPVHKAPPPPPPLIERPDPGAATLATGSRAAVQPRPPAPTPAPAPAPEPGPAPTQPPEQLADEPLPNIAPDNADELPNVEGWDEADEVAREEASPS